jgi:hypothetical protein
VNPEQIPFERLRREIQLQPDRQYYFVDSLVVTSTTRRVFRKVEGTGAGGGTAFLVDGKLYVSNERFQTSRQVWIPPFNLRHLRSSEGGESDRLTQLLRMSNPSPEERHELLDLVRRRSVLGAPTELPGILSPPPRAHLDDPNVIALRLEGVRSLRQKSRNACWATAAAILVSWREKRVLQPEEFLREYAPRWLTPFLEDTGLAADAKSAFLADSGLCFEWGAGYMPSAIRDLLQAYGPLWFTIGTPKSFGTHAVIVVGVAEVAGNAWVSVIDPRDGREHDLSYGEFHRMYDEGGYLANEEFLRPNDGVEDVYTIHVVHCAARDTKR